MKTASVEELGYIIKRAKINKSPKPILLLGAGASISAGIPSAEQIKDSIIKEYSDNPAFEKINLKESGYDVIMNCLPPNDRRKILRKYVEKSKVNVTHIYMAHLINTGYIDYILTTNFDDLAIRALALYNRFPTIYDISILKDLTTTNLELNSIIYLHGKFDGFWQLNTVEEMGKINKIVPSILNRISNNRTWIIVGYSGNDPIFDHLVELGRFDNGLYWLAYDTPSAKVQKELLNKENTESYVIKGQSSDEFFLELNNFLGNSQPDIFNKPFSYLKKIHDNIIDIDGRTFSGVKKRLTKSRLLINDSIKRYELFTDDERLKKGELKKIKVDKQLTEILATQDFSNAETVLDQINKKDKKSHSELIYNIYNNWGIDLAEHSQTLEDKEALIYLENAFKKFKKATDIKPDKLFAWVNWAGYQLVLIERFNQFLTNEQFESVYEKFRKAIKIDSYHFEIWNDWGKALYLNSTIEDDRKKVITTLEEASRKFSKSTEINNTAFEPWFNWGKTLGMLASVKDDKHSIALYKASIERFKKSIDIDPNFHHSYSFIGLAFFDLYEASPMNKSNSYLLKASEYFEKAYSITDDPSFLVYKSLMLFIASDIGLEKEKEKIKVEAKNTIDKAIDQNPAVLKQIENDDNWVKYYSKTNIRALN